MAVSSKFAGFLDKATDRLAQIEQSLRRHDKNPNDREFLNDISKSVHAIKNAALPAGLGRISELCFHLENFLQRVRQEKSAISLEKMEILVASKDRLGKLVHDIESAGIERATVKDLLKRIQQELEGAAETVAPAPEAAAKPQPRKPAAKPEPLTPVLESMSPEPAPRDDGGSLLPAEIKNQEYDPELFQIFIEQMQENLSLLQALCNGYAKSASKAKTITICSELVGKLQSSANYMGYERLADYYLQWVAELEMAGVELSMGNPVPFAFMDVRLNTILGLFPQVKDAPASAAAVRKVEMEMAPQQPEVREKITTSAAAKPEEPASFKDLFRGMDGGEAESFDEATGPIAALSDYEPPAEKPAGPAARASEGTARKKRITAAPVEIDATFLEEERQSPEFDEELFQIFVQQLQENLTQLRTLANDYPRATNKASIVNQCSTLVGKLQSSANYMGYEPLAEYYLQWIAELEMAGVELSLGTAVSFAFMDEKIRKIVAIFPQVKDPGAPAVQSPARPAPPPPRQKPEREHDDNESFKELFIGLDEDEDEEFDEESVPIAALAGVEETVAWHEEAGPEVEATLPEVENFFGGPVESPAQRQKAAAAAPAFNVDALFGEEEEVAHEPEPIAALSGAEEITPPGAALAEESTLPELDAFFGELGVEAPAPVKKPAAPAAPAHDLDALFGEEEASVPALEPIAALSGAEEITSPRADLAEESDLPELDAFLGELGVEAPAPAKKPAAPAAPAHDLEGLFGEEETSVPALEPIAALSEIKERAETETEPAPAAAAALPEVDNFFGEFAEGVEESFDLGGEPIAALSDAEFAGPAAPPAAMPSARKTEDIETLFADEEEAPASLKTEAEDEIEGLFAATSGGDDLDFEAEDESLAALADSPVADQALANREAAPRRKLAEPVEDLVALFGEEAEEPAPAIAATPPHRQELFQKLSHALKSLDEEVPTLEAAVDKSREKAAKAVPGSPAPTPATEEDEKLFARLFGALETTAEDDDRSAAKPINQVIEEILAGTVAPAAPAQPEPEKIPEQLTVPEIRQKFTLDPERMNSLMDQVGELAASRASLARLHQEMSSLHHHLREAHVLDQNELTPLQDLLLRLEDTTSVLGRVSNEISEGVLKVRMVPAGQLFGLYQDVVAELAQKARKEVALSIQGEDAGIDQFTVTDLGDCLLHLISNSISHGFESTEERQRQGKKPAGTLTLSAALDGNHMVIEVADDGRGIDPKIIKATALAREMFTGDELYRMSDRDLTRLLMTPGFSTANGSTPESKGAGLDRVKAIIDRLGGTVQISSTVGQGTRVRLLVPLKLPTVQALKVRAGAAILALPLNCVEEIVRVTPENLIQAAKAELISFRNENIPLYSLAQLAKVKGAGERGARFPVVVVKSDAGLAGLIVDETLGLDEVAVKPLAEYLRQHRDAAGATIKGEDDISFIPDLAGLMKTAHAAVRI